MTTLSNKMQDALNRQINAEFYSSYLYLSMASYLQSINLTGSGSWMRLQAQEEYEHGIKIIDYVEHRLGRVFLSSIDGPAAEWTSVLDVFEDAFKNEQDVTTMIHNLVNLAADEKDHATSTFLQWYVNEQVEEEATADEIVQKLKMAGGEPSGLLFIDSDLGKRGLE